MIGGEACNYAMIKVRGRHVMCWLLIESIIDRSFANIPRDKGKIVIERSKRVRNFHLRDLAADRESCKSITIAGWVILVECVPVNNG